MTDPEHIDHTLNNGALIMLAAILLPLLLVGCGKENRASYEAWNTWSERIVLVPAKYDHRGIESVMYLDKIPRMDFSSSDVTYEPGAKIMHWAPNGDLVAHQWIAGEVIP